uniref:Nonsense-mediated mRNA decay protein NMD3 family protein n=1 Tax=Aliivibrio wodanis TaxID=80852 RepID=A0A5Q4ZVY7_9GAMM|nr:hypothetical protein AW0309160_03792 [Aliivibrio wodanis]
MYELKECPCCLSDELLVSDNEETVICSECGVIKRNGTWLIIEEKKLKATA